VIPRALLEVVVKRNAVPIHRHPAPMLVKIESINCSLADIEACGEIVSVRGLME
jgi:hypothetical protein